MQTLSRLFKRPLLLILPLTLLSSCSPLQEKNNNEVPLSQAQTINHHTQGLGKPVIYQVFTRLFGNKVTNNQAWGTTEQNGVGKFDDFNDSALQGIAQLGTSYIWYTGVLHHALINDYSAIGISNDDPDVVKGRAGSPYAIKDYYNVNPDLAVNPAQRMEEFEDLIERTHKHNMRVIIDIVPNHVARNYASSNLPEGQQNFGANDNKAVAYHKHNNFYYVENKPFIVPDVDPSKKPLGGQQHELSDGYFDENPAKWTGNGSRLAKPNANDWYETVKINYGVRPDSTYDFPKLDDSFRSKSSQQHYEFWQQQSDLPDSWYKMEAIAHFWLDKGVDGFRFDMAELVPVEFWSFLNSSIKQKRKDFLLLAEVYNPSIYKDYIELGKMDYLYDKVDFYDRLKEVMQGKSGTQTLDDIQRRFADIEPHLLHFLENHDEQRIASPEFVGNAIIGKPALVVSALISRSPTLIYFGQEVGEDGSENAGFGEPSRTSIFDYIGVPAHQRWMNNGEFDGGQLSQEERELRQFYEKVLTLSASHPTMLGHYQSLHALNLEQNSDYSEDQFAFVRTTEDQAIVVVTNFSPQQKSYSLVINESTLSPALISEISSGDSLNLLSGEPHNLSKKNNQYYINIQLEPYDSKVISLAGR
ncbi:alpha-amylase [Alteromonadaceae bacterium M269]|nr:alpha-amylase [Alteromonadaceae bacterium M269]